MIFDLDDNPVQSFPFSIESEEVKTFTVRLECRTNYFLRAQNVSLLTIEARKAGESSWTNIETDAINLSAFDGTRQNFEIRMTAAEVSGAENINFKITVGA